MNPGDVRYTVSFLHSGQPRPYADSVYKFTLTIERIPYGDATPVWVPAEHADELFDAAAQVLGHSFMDKSDPARKWHQPYLAERTRDGNSVTYTVIEPYTD